VLATKANNDKVSHCGTTEGLLKYA